VVVVVVQTAEAAVLVDFLLVLHYLLCPELRMLLL
jgi:hypothetical protein